MLGCAFGALAGLAPAAVQPDAMAPDFTLRAVDGPNLRLYEQRGRVVLVNFWASWCRRCLDATPHLNRLHEKYGASGMLLLGISVDEDPAQAAAVAARLGVRFPVLLDPERSVIRRYDPAALPSTLLIDRDGRVRYVHAGFHDDLAFVIEGQIRELLAQ
jgi:peroxiredoxin